MARGNQKIKAQEKNQKKTASEVGIDILARPIELSSLTL
jgi:4F5 protein related disordered region